jgi:hypothetical protein
MSAFSLSTICQQRLSKMQFNVPPVRYTPISPYSGGQYTQQQLNMRRKVEILAYSANKSSSQTNNLTKAEKWSNIVNGKSLTKNANGYYSQLTQICSEDNLIPTPTSSCDVPGPIINLYLDPSVPLYNYVSNVDAYGIINPPIKTGWTINAVNDVQCPNNMDTNITTLCIRNELDQTSYTYTIQTPIAIYINGTTTGSTSSKVTLASITPIIYFSGSQVQNINPLCKLNGQLISNTIVDVSLNHTSLNNATPYAYSAIVYIGTLTISNITLQTEPGYVYDIHLKCNLSQDNINISPNIGIYCNLTTNIYNTLSANLLNATVLSGAYPSAFSEFTLSGQ